MSRYHSHSNASENAAPGRRDDQVVRQDRESPVEGSERGSAQSTNTHGAKDDPESSDDPYFALTTQALNPDGSPRRPMNAFMIFARKRRPQISAANQMMRTGDISKILSREWNAMDMSDKKFYLDQAKKLKDNFNTKWPDYVYRRRPNNTRKKRKPDGAYSPSDPSPSADVEDTGYDDTSPIDSEDLMLSAADFPDSRSHTGSISSAYEGHSSSFSPQTSPSYAYPPEFTQTQYGQQSTRPGHASPLDVTSPPGGLSSFKSTILDSSHSSGQSYHTQAVPSSHSQSPTSYYPSQNPYTNQGSWDPNRTALRTEQGRSNLPSLPAIDTTSISRYRLNPVGSIPSSRADTYSPEVPHRPYSTSSSSTVSISPGASASHYSNPNFPMLTSAFTPADSQSQRYTSVAPNVSSSHASNTQEYFQPSSQYAPRASSSGRHNTYESGGYAPPSLSSAYPQWHGSMPQDVRPSGSQRLPNTIPPLSSYQSHPSTSASPDESSPVPPLPSSAHHNSSHMAYWDRTKFEER